jgi:hypothetical protein
LNAQVTAIATKLLKIAGAFVALYAVSSGALFAIMLQSPDKFAGAMKYIPWPALVVLPFKPRWNVGRQGDQAVGDTAEPKPRVIRSANVKVPQRSNLCCSRRLSCR